MKSNIMNDQLNHYISILKKMIDCKTVFLDDGSNECEFIKFNKVIEESFPNIIKRAHKFVFGSGCFVYLIKGKNATKNVMLMSHHDVVKETDGWNTNPFDATLKDGCLYGRGTIDTKTPLFAELMAVEELLENWPLDNLNVYIGSSNNEEVCGDGMVLAAQYFKENNIFFDVVLDEGGAITEGMIPGYSGKSAMVAVHEKSRHMFLCEVKNNAKGHGGLVPSDDNVIIRLNKFIEEVSNTNIYPSKFYPEVKATFCCHAPYMKFPMNVIFSKLELFGFLVKKIMMKIPQARAMLNTSITFTSYVAGDKLEPQIKAKEAKCTMFIRCIREDDLERGMSIIKKIAEKYGVEITMIERDYCRPTSFDTIEYKIVENVVHKNFEDVVVAPFLLTAGTDARRFTDISHNILRFAPIVLSKEQFSTIHGDNENINVENVGQCVKFYKEFLLEYGKVM